MKQRLTDKQYLTLWQEYKDNILRSTTVDTTESYSDQQARIKRLEADDEAWFKYYFPDFSYAEPAPFHKKSTKRVMNSPELYLVRAWSRELAKSTRTMMEVLKLALTGKKKNVILVSNSLDNAGRLLLPYKTNLEFNQRLIPDYGIQEKLGSWEAYEFTTRGGVAFRALGAGQSPRGARKDAVRPDVLLVDDIDTDEDCLNPQIIKKRWRWIERALFGTRSISNPLLIIFCGNIIAKFCCITEAIKKADHTEVVNIRDKDGRSTWPQKNSEEMIDRVLGTMSTNSAQQEYFNDPNIEGEVFKEIYWGKVPPLRRFRLLVGYGDPATSNKDNSKSSSKVLVLVGRYLGNYYIIKAWANQCRNSVFIDWYYDLEDYVGGRAQLYRVIENNTLQDPFYEQVFKPLFFAKGQETKRVIPIIGDTRKKPGKFDRIDGNLEPLNRDGHLIFNEDEKDNPHMVRVTEQFLGVSPESKMMDAPDAVEGAVWIINEKEAIAGSSHGIQTIARPTNPKSY